MVGVLRDQHMREQARAGDAAIDGPRRGFGLNDFFAAAAAQLGAHMAHDLEARWNILQHLGDVFAELAQLAALGAGVRSRRVSMYFARQVLRQRTAAGPRSIVVERCTLRYRALGADRLQLFELQLQLLDLARDPLALGAKQHPAKLGDDQLQMFDLAVVGKQLSVLDNQLAVLGQQQRPQSIGVECAQIGKRRRRNHDLEYAIERVKLHQKMCSLILPPEVPSYAPHAASRCLPEASTTARE